MNLHKTTNYIVKLAHQQNCNAEKEIKHQFIGV